MKIKYKDIAEQLGISTTAVSLALNNKPGVSEDTRQKVFNLYKNQFENLKKPAAPDAFGNKEKAPILLVIHKKHSKIINDKPFFSDLVTTIEQECMRHSYPLRILNFLPGQDLKDFVLTIKNIKFSGMILLATEMDSSDLVAYKTIDKPIVLLDSSFGLERFNSVAINNRDSIIQAMEYVYSMGHRNIGYLQSSVYINNFGSRLEGFKEGLRYFGIEDYNHPIYALGCTVDQAYKDMKQILQDKSVVSNLPTVFLSDLDYIAIGAQRALTEQGLKIPDDISIVGYDDVEICEFIQPKLTTVRVNRLDIGRLALERVFQLIDYNEDTFYTSTYISTNLVIRDSVKRISST